MRSCVAPTTTGSSESVLIDFWASWCGPCQRLAPELEKLASEHNNLIIGKIDVDDQNNVDLALQLGVNSIPALFFYKNGKLVKRLTGYMTKDELAEQLGLIS